MEEVRGFGGRPVGCVADLGLFGSSAEVVLLLQDVKGLNQFSVVRFEYDICTIDEIETELRTTILEKTVHIPKKQLVHALIEISSKENSAMQTYLDYQTAE